MNFKKHITAAAMAPVGWMLHAIALLPFRALYVLADALFAVAYYLLRYRRKIVWKNLVECFPEKSRDELKKIEKEFYHHFADYFFETIKLLHISDDEMRRRMVFHNAEIIDEALDADQSLVLYAAHYGNWEWVTSVTMWFGAKRQRGNVLGQVYQRIENEWFDAFFLKLRTRFGTRCFEKREIIREMLRDEREGRHSAIGFISDQHPWVNDEGHVIEFLNHPTAMITGAEAIARKINARAAFFDVRKTGRGHYECTLVPLSNACAMEPKGRITNLYARMLEKRIKDEPAYWLWTHNRWKRPVKLPDDSNNNTISATTAPKQQ